MSDKVLFFRGKKVDDMDREALIEAVKFGAHMIETLEFEKKHEREFLLGLRDSV